MSMSVGKSVHAFMSLMGQPAPERPAPLHPDRWELRTDLIAEEAKELDEAYEAGDDAAFLDACVDLVYVIVGTAIEKGLPFDAAFEAVHRANMSKAVPCDECAGNGTIATTIRNRSGNMLRERCEECRGRGVKVIYRADGKILKPVGWTAPDIEKVIEEANARVEGV